jgi:hypothetical protein
LRHKLALAMFFLLVALVAAGCVSGVQSSPYANAVTGKQIYNLSNVSSWKYAVVMSAGGANSTWNMTVNQTTALAGIRHMEVGTIGNGMDIVYDIWYNASTFQVDRMHAKGWIGDYYQERNVSNMQIYTLPDTGLIYYFVPLQYAGAVSVRDASGQTGQLGVFTATDNKGFRLTYWTHPAMPLPAKIEMSSRDFNITMMLISYS